MSWSVNEMLQVACEDLMLVEDGEPVSGILASKAENCLNRAITSLNSDGYMSQCVRPLDVTAAGKVVFKRLESGETKPQNVIDIAPPDNVTGVSRKIGIRWMRLRPSNPQAMDRAITYSFPTLWSYGVDYETAPSGEQRQVGVLDLNGTYPSELRIYLNSQMSHYKLGDTIYLSSLYYNLVLYALELKLVDKYKLKSYEDGVKLELTAAMKAVDTNTANNRPLDNGLEECGDYLAPYYDLIGGVGM